MILGETRLVADSLHEGRDGSLEVKSAALAGKYSIFPEQGQKSETQKSLGLKGYMPVTGHDTNSSRGPIQKE